MIDKIVSHIDIFPTICDVMNLKKPTYLEGNSILPLLNQSNNEIREVVFAEINFHTSYEPARCVRDERFKYVKYYDNEWLKINVSNIDNSDPKDFLLDHQLQEIKKPPEALYDLYYDPYEKHNLIADKRYENELIRLKEQMYNIQVKTNDPLLHGDIEVISQYKVNKKSCINPSSNDPDDYDPRGSLS